MGAGSHNRSSGLTAMLLARLDRLEADNRRLAAKVAALERPAATAAMVEAIFSALGDKNFLSREIRALAEQRPSLNAAIMAAVDDAWTPKKLGNKLADVCDQNVGGYTVIQLTREGRSGALWKIMRTA